MILLWNGSFTKIKEVEERSHGSVKNYVAQREGVAHLMVDYVNLLSVSSQRPTLRRRSRIHDFDMSAVILALNISHMPVLLLLPTS